MYIFVLLCDKTKTFINFTMTNSLFHIIIICIYLCIFILLCLQYIMQEVFIQGIWYVLIYFRFAIRTQFRVTVTPQCRTWQALPFFCPEGAHIFNGYIKTPKRTGTDRNGPKRTGTDRNGPERTWKMTGTDLKSTETDLKSTGTDLKSTGTDFKSTETDS